MNDPTRLPSRPRTAYPRALVSRSRSCLGSLLRCAAPTTEILPVTRRVQRPDREEDSGERARRLPERLALIYSPFGRFGARLLLSPGRAVSAAVPTPNRRAGLRPPNVRATSDLRRKRVSRAVAMIFVSRGPGLRRRAAGRARDTGGDTPPGSLSSWQSDRRGTSGP
jgi:hypothetical protein